MQGSMFWGEGFPLGGLTHAAVCSHEARWIGLECCSRIWMHGTCRASAACIVVDGVRGHQADAALGMHVVVPVEESLAVSTWASPSSPKCSQPWFPC